MSQLGPDRCRSCDAPIRWAISDSTGKRMPLDPGENPAGNMAVRLDESVGHLRVHSLPKDAPLQDGEKRAVTHFATCPDAAQHRRPK